MNSSRLSSVRLYVDLWKGEGVIVMDAYSGRRGSPPDIAEVIGHDEKWDLGLLGPDRYHVLQRNIPSLVGLYGVIDDHLRKWRLHTIKHPSMTNDRVVASYHFCPGEPVDDAYGGLVEYMGGIQRSGNLLGR